VPTLTVAEAQSRLPQIIDQLRPGEEVVITRDDRPVARLLPPALPKGVPVYGRGKGKMSLDADDDSHLADFAEYMP
jgi:antitoxin (DNA-binding transcriptional repressor) of toxin-antitoxin stability system